MSIIRLSLTHIADLKSVLGVGDKVLVIRGLSGWPLWEEDRGCPRAGHSWLQTAWQWTHAGHSQAHQPLRWCSCENIGRERAEMLEGERRRKHKEQGQRKHQGERRRRCSMVEQAHPKGTAARRGTHAGAQEKSEKEGAAERNCYVVTAIPSCHPLPHCRKWV